MRTSSEKLLTLRSLISTVQPAGQSLCFSLMMISRDLHAFASRRIHRNEKEDLSKNPIHCILSGPLGNNVFPSTFRKIKASTPAAIGIEKDFENVAENGFSIIDVDRRNITVKMFKFLWSRDILSDIEHLDPFRMICI